MNDTGNKYALAALRDKRAILAGEIAQLEKQAKWKREQLGHVDATLSLFDPNYREGSILAKKPYRHVKLFKQGELGRLILDSLRRAGGPLSTAEVVTAVMAEGHQGESVRAAMTPRVRGNLAYLERQGKVRKSGRGKTVTFGFGLIRAYPSGSRN
jgi:hypothetical protein